jgi:hypothetical protein
LKENPALTQEIEGKIRELFNMGATKSLGLSTNEEAAEEDL